MVHHSELTYFTPRETTFEVDDELSEIFLRKEILIRLHKINEKTHRVIIDTFTDFFEETHPGTVLLAIQQAIQEAERSTEWKGNNGERSLGMGYYSSFEEFFTLFFHELGHNVLTRLGKKKTDYSDVAEPEEEFCWRFAHRMCMLLDLPFSHPVAELNWQFFVEKSRWSQISREDLLIWLKNFEALIELERQLFSVSLQESYKCVWDERGVPKISEE